MEAAYVLSLERDDVIHVMPFRSVEVDVREFFTYTGDVQHTVAHLTLPSGAAGVDLLPPH